MHDGLRVVGHSVVDRADLGELTDVRPEVLVQDSDVVVSVMPLLLVPHSQGVTDLVDGDTKLEKKYLLNVISYRDEKVFKFVY